MIDNTTGELKDLRLFIGEQQSGLSSCFIKLLVISYLLSLCAAKTGVNMNKGRSGCFCGLSLGQRQSWTLKKCKHFYLKCQEKWGGRGFHLVEREALASPVQDLFLPKRNSTETGDLNIIQAQSLGVSARGEDWVLACTTLCQCGLKPGHCH